MKKKSPKKNISEIRGVKQTQTTNIEAIKQIQLRRRSLLDCETLFDNIIKGDRTALSQGITLIESAKHDDRVLANTLINKCLSRPKPQSIRVGITGVPGVGKSTFIESLGQYLTERGERIAVLAIDPSSNITKGSILGDKTRMMTLVQNENAFIRPTPTGTVLGGVGQYTREAIILCETAGFSTILIETVGVGQNEVTVNEIVDFCMLLKLAGAGDELQGIKRGVIEMADSILIHKADGDNIKAAKLAKLEFRNSLHLYAQKQSGWQPKIQLCSSLTGKGIKEAWQLVENYISITQSNGYFEQNRENQNIFWMKKAIENKLQSSFFEHPGIQSEITKQMERVKTNMVTPFQAAEALFDLYKSRL